MILIISQNHLTAMSNGMPVISLRSYINIPSSTIFSHLKANLKEVNETLGIVPKCLKTLNEAANMIWVVLQNHENDIFDLKSLNDTIEDYISYLEDDMKKLYRKFGFKCVDN